MKSRQRVYNTVPIPAMLLALEDENEVALSQEPLYFLLNKKIEGFFV